MKAYCDGAQEISEPRKPEADSVGEGLTLYLFGLL